MAVTNRSQLANGTQTQQGLYNQSIARKAQLENQQKYLQMAQASPAFALGNLIGNLLADGYNSRGVNKEKQAISEALANYRGGQDYNAMNNILNSPTLQETAQSLSSPNGISVGEQINLPNNTLPTQSENSIVSPQLSTYGPALSSFNADKFKAKYYEDARKRGRTDDQINEAWSSMQPQITELANKAKEARIDTALSAMSPDENGKFSFGAFSMSNPMFLNYLRPLMKDNPEMATYLMKGATAQDKENAALQRQTFANASKMALQQGNQKFQLDRDSTNNAIKIAIAKAKLANKNGNTNAISDQRYKNIKTALDQLALIEKGDGITPGRALTSEEQMQKDVLQRQANSYLYGGLSGYGQQPVTPGQKQNVLKIGDTTVKDLPNVNNYDDVLADVGNAIAKLSSKRYNKEDIVRHIKAVYSQRYNGKTGYLDDVLNGIDWKAYGVEGA